MYIEVSFSVVRELCSQRFPHRIAFASSEEVDEWAAKMDQTHGENGWLLGDENVYPTAKMPRWPLWTPTLWAWFYSYRRA